MKYCAIVTENKSIKFFALDVAIMNNSNESIPGLIYRCERISELMAFCIGINKYELAVNLPISDRIFDESLDCDSKSVFDYFPEMEIEKEKEYTMIKDFF